MKLLFLLTAVSWIASAQEPKPAVDPKLHESAVTLVQATGAYEKMKSSVPQMVEDAKKRMGPLVPQATPEFLEEWGKRMAARIQINEYVDVIVRVYEKHFTTDELQELIALQLAKKDQKRSLSAALQEKLSSEMPKVMGEIVGACTELGAKLGAKIGTEIEKEHPEWLKP
jgi:hypothetical protein